MDDNMAATTSRPRRLHQAWKGSNVFLCGGRLIFGPDATSILLTTFLIASPCLAFCTHVILQIRKHANSDTQEDSSILGIPVLVVAAVFTALDLIFLFLTSSRDPGIVPRNAQPPQETDEVLGPTISPSMEWVTGRTSVKLPRMKEVVVNGYAVKVKYCETCLLYRPPRASHCSICNNCVQKFDHHCPWVGQCIGLRNYRFFFLFISTSTFLCLFVFTFSWLNILEQRSNGSFLKAMRGEILSLVLIIYTFISVWFVGGLTVFHLYLISTNQTTYENFRYRYDKKENPYNKGTLRNFMETFFSKIPPSLNDFRSWVFEEPSEIQNDSQTAMVDISDRILKTGNSMDDKPINDNTLPLILQNLNYDGAAFDSDAVSRISVDVADLLSFPVGQKPHSGECNEANTDRFENFVDENTERGSGLDSSMDTTDNDPDVQKR